VASPDLETGASKQLAAALTCAHLPTNLDVIERLLLLATAAVAFSRINRDFDDSCRACGSANEPRGAFDSHGAPIAPSNLYLSQLCDRLGMQAVSNIGY